MSCAELQLRENAASQLQISNHLVECDDRFAPRLSERVDIGSYSAKIHQHAIRFEMWCDDELIGLVAVYFDESGKMAFITNVSISAPFLGRGIASTLVGITVHRAIEYRLDRICLQVDATNRNALRLYEKHGFSALADEAGSVSMVLDLKERYS